MPTRAVLFDFDGVIADTENVHVAAWQRTFGLMGWLESDETCSRAAEIDDRAFCAEVFERRKLEGGDHAGWAARKQELTVRLLTDCPRVYPGLASLVQRLEGRVQMGVVTSTSRANVEAVLKATGLSAAFGLIIAKEDVTSPKPDPEGYRLALARLGLPKDSVVALEDSPTGLASARSAGLRVVAVGHRKPKGDWSGEAPYLDGFTDPDPVIRAMGLDPDDRPA